MIVLLVSPIALWYDAAKLQLKVASHLCAGEDVINHRVMSKPCYTKQACLRAQHKKRLHTVALQTKPPKKTK